jgi:peptidoglycan/LPS O-acetylase OafA/YrhL
MEEQFYMAWPWIVAKLRTPNSILRGCAAASALALLLRIAVWASGSLSMTCAYTFLLCRMDELACGAAIAILIRGPFQDRLQRLAPALFITSTLAFAGICWGRHTLDHDDAMIATAGYTLIAAAYGSLLVLCLPANSWLQHLFSLRALRLFGKYSYGLYLYHFPLTVVLSPMKDLCVAKVHSFVLGSTIHIIFCLAVNLTVAIISFHLFEAPIMRLKDRFQYSTARSRSLSGPAHEEGSNVCMGLAADNNPGIG